MGLRMVRRGAVVALTVAVALPGAVLAGDSAKPASTAKPTGAQIARGRYLVTVGNCNDCHTQGFAPRDGDVPESEWLKGGSLGFNGPWGTTYASNLRSTVSNMTEAQWVPFAKSLKTRPPMPWFNLNRWTDQDLRALYQYIKSLGPAGNRAPTFVPPDKQAPPPYIQRPAPPK